MLVVSRLQRFKEVLLGGKEGRGDVMGLLFPENQFVLATTAIGEPNFVFDGFTQKLLDEVLRLDQFDRTLLHCILMHEEDCLTEVELGFDGHELEEIEDAKAAGDQDGEAAGGRGAGFVLHFIIRFPITGSLCFSIRLCPKPDSFYFRFGLFFGK